MGGATEEPVRDHLVHHSGNGLFAIRQGNWKLIHYYESDRQELFNLQDDPGETNNLVAEQPVRAQVLRAKLDDWRRSVDAKEPTPNSDWDSSKK